MELLEEILNPENLNKAYKKVYQNKGASGVDGVTVEERAREYLNDGYDWIVDIDLEKFFDTVNQDRLITIIRRTIKDGDVVSLIRKYLSAGVMENGVLKPTEQGTPQGGNLSPLLSNIMLNELDKELEARGLNFVRYADDCIILVKSEKAANRVLSSITKYIEKKLGLKVNAENR